MKSGGRQVLQQLTHAVEKPIPERLRVVTGVVLHKDCYHKPWLTHKDAYFLMGRKSNLEYRAGKWEFFGGKVEEGESYPTALNRELIEELGSSFQFHIDSFLCNVKHDSNEEEHPDALKLELNAYLVRHIDGDITLSKEHDKFEWMNCDAALSLAHTNEISPSDLEIIYALNTFPFYRLTTGSTEYGQADIPRHQ